MLWGSDVILAKRAEDDALNEVLWEAKQFEGSSAFLYLAV